MLTAGQRYGVTSKQTELSIRSSTSNPKPKLNTTPYFKKPRLLNCQQRALYCLISFRALQFKILKYK